MIKKTYNAVRRLYTQIKEYMTRHKSIKWILILTGIISVIYPVSFHYGYTGVWEHEKSEQYRQTSDKLLISQIAIGFVTDNDTITICNGTDSLIYNKATRQLKRITVRQPIVNRWLVWRDGYLSLIHCDDDKRFDLHDADNEFLLMIKHIFHIMTWEYVKAMFTESVDKESTPFLLKLSWYFGAGQGYECKAKMLSKKYYYIDNGYPALNTPEWWHHVHQISDDINTSGSTPIERFNSLSDHINLY